MENQHILQPGSWVSNYADMLFAYTIVRVKDTPTAEDIVQETFLSAWKARAGYHGEASEKNWLYAICKNKIIDFYRGQSSRSAIVVTGDSAGYFDGEEHWTTYTRPKEWNIDYTQPVETNEFYRVLETCKKKLKDMQQAVFVMKYMEELESVEICKLLEIEPSYYWVLIHRAKLHLRKCLETNWLNIQ